MADRETRGAMPPDIYARLTTVHSILISICLSLKSRSRILNQWSIRTGLTLAASVWLAGCSADLLNRDTQTLDRFSHAFTAFQIAVSEAEITRQMVFADADPFGYWEELKGGLDVRGSDVSRLNHATRAEALQDSAMSSAMADCWERLNKVDKTVFQLVEFANAIHNVEYRAEAVEITRHGREVFTSYSSIFEIHKKRLRIQSDALEEIIRDGGQMRVTGSFRHHGDEATAMTKEIDEAAQRSSASFQELHDSFSALKGKSGMKEYGANPVQSATSSGGSGASGWTLNGKPVEDGQHDKPVNVGSTSASDTWKVDGKRVAVGGNNQGQPIGGTGEMIDGKLVAGGIGRNEAALQDLDSISAAQVRAVADYRLPLPGWAFDIEDGYWYGSLPAKEKAGMYGRDSEDCPVESCWTCSTLERRDLQWLNCAVFRNGIASFYADARNLRIPYQEATYIVAKTVHGMRQSEIDIEVNAARLNMGQYYSELKKKQIKSARVAEQE